MTLLHLNKMLQTPFGRVINFLLIIAILNLNSCTVYKPAETNMAALKATEQVTANLDVYKFFVHDTYNSYQLSNPVFNEDGSISGNIALTSYQTPDSTWSNKDRKAYWKEHKYDINIFTETVLSVLSADLSSTDPVSETVTISSSMINKMTITSIDAERQSSDAAVVVLGVLGLIVVAVLVILLFNAADGGGGGGDGSGSASGSD